MGKFGNFMGNTLGIVPRGAGTGVLAGLDTVKTGANVFTDIGAITANTTTKLWDILSSSWNKGKWYNKLYQIPIGLVAGAGTLIEGAVRLVVEPTRNIILNTRDVLGNLGINAGSSIKSLFDTTRPASSFSFEKLQTKKPTGKNWFSKLAWWNNTPTPTPTP